MYGYVPPLHRHLRLRGATEPSRGAWWRKPACAWHAGPAQRPGV